MWLAKTGAHVTSIEIDPHCRDVASENLKNAGLGGNSEIILGAALDVTPKLVEERRKCDMVFIDADWGEQWEYFELAVSLTRKNGCIYVDNVVQDLIYQIQDSLLEETIVTKVGKDNRVTATLLPTITSYKEGKRKAFIDGFILATVN
ncbi:hypothetical protein PWT90_02605 [Aphanocladium album]|nr:hypothetical protein PWT90_02605 [Aphanocladium album]